MCCNFFKWFYQENDNNTINNTNIDYNSINDNNRNIDYNSINDNNRNIDYNSMNDNNRNNNNHLVEKDDLQTNMNHNYQTHINMIYFLRKYKIITIDFK